MARVLNILGSSAPQLTRFRGVVGKPDDPPAGTPQQQLLPPPLFPAGMPSIQFLETDLPDTILPTVALGSLTTLHLNGLSPTISFQYAELMQVFKSTSKTLVSLSLQGGVDLAKWPLDSTMPSFTLPQLRNLRLLDDSMTMVRFLLSVSAPKLESLWLDATIQQFHHYVGSPQIQQAALTQLAGTTSTNANRGSAVKFPALRYLTVPTYGFSYVNLLALAFPTVTKLHFPHANFNFHAKRLNDSLKQIWSGVDTIVVSLPREKQIDRMLDTLLDCRGVQQVLLDGDTLKILKKSHSIHPVAKKAKLLEVYKEPWWMGNVSTRRGGYGLPFGEV